MISQINNNRYNINFYGTKLKVPKKSNCKISSQINTNKLKEKITDKFTKIKTEFNSLDEESKDLLFKTVVGFTILSTVVGTIIYYVCKIVDKIKELFWFFLLIPYIIMIDNNFWDNKINYIT